MANQLAPVALFIYKRASHTQKSLESLSRCNQFSKTPVYVFCDGAKSIDDENSVQQARDVVKQQNWPNLTIIERTENWGLAKSIIAGVTELCERYGRVIVLEDDLEVAPYFLDYMNAALDKYADTEQVMQVSGYMFPVELNTDTDSIFLPFTTSWGWATWSRSWIHFDPEAKGYASLRNDTTRKKSFDLDGSYPYFRALEQQQRGKLNSWAVRWYLSVFIKHGLVLYPKYTLVRNNGFDGTGTNWKARESGLMAELQNTLVRTFPKHTIVHEESYKTIVSYLRRYNNPFLKFLRRARATILNKQF